MRYNTRRQQNALLPMQIHLDEVCRQQNNSDYLRQVRLRVNQMFLPE